MARLSTVNDDETSDENKAFSEATPSGSLDIAIDSEVPANNFFKENREYYLDFTRINVEESKK